MDQVRQSLAEDSGHGGLQVLITTGPARFVADEPVALGGLDLGPTPHDLICAGLAACTTQTLRLYAKHKGWTLGAIRVAVSHDRKAAQMPADSLTRVISFDGDLDEAQRARLLEIAEMCPIHKMLTAGVTIVTRVEVLAN